MTQEEAIKTLKGEAWIGCAEKWDEALDMATKALKQGDAINKIWLEVEGLKFAHEPNFFYEIHNKAIEIVLRIIDRNREESEGEK